MSEKKRETKRKSSSSKHKKTTERQWLVKTTHRVELGAHCTITTKQPALTVEAAKPNENSTPTAAAHPQPVLPTTANARSTRSGKVIKVLSRFVHD